MVNCQHLDKGILAEMNKRYFSKSQYWKTLAQSSYAIVLHAQGQQKLNLNSKPTEVSNVILTNFIHDTMSEKHWRKEKQEEIKWPQGLSRSLKIAEIIFNVRYKAAQSSFSVTYQQVSSHLTLVHTVNNEKLGASRHIYGLSFSKNIFTNKSMHSTCFEQKISTQNEYVFRRWKT